MSQIVIVGAGEVAEMACEYFTHDSPHEVAGFAVEKAHLTRDRLAGLEVVPFESMETAFPPDRFAAFVAISYTQLNRVRARLYAATKARGYRLESYVSSRASVWHNAKVGENCLIQEDNTIQFSVSIGDDCILWAGNHIGHQTAIGAHTFISSHVVISGYCRVGESCFLGVNSSVGDNLTIANDCVIGMGAVVNRSTEPGRVYVGNPARALEKSSFDAFGVADGDRPPG